MASEINGSIWQIMCHLMNLALQLEKAGYQRDNQAMDLYRNTFIAVEELHEYLRAKEIEKYEMAAEAEDESDGNG